MSPVEIAAALLGEAAKKLAPEIVSAGVPYLVKAAAEMFAGNEDAAAKHIRIGAQKIAAKAWIQAPKR